MELKLCAFSDTHDVIKKDFKLPEVDIAIFGGDLTSRGEKAGVERFLKWYEDQQQCLYRIFIAGNHDICFDSKFEKETNASSWLPELFKKYDVNGKTSTLRYLENTGEKILGLNIWGSPITPDFFPEHWAFNKPRGYQINEVWNNIPTDTDILVTHGPVFGIGDFIPSQQKYVGCEQLRERVKDIKPRVHQIAHIHEGYGVYEDQYTKTINASICNEHYKPVHKPIEFKINV